MIPLHYKRWWHSLLISVTIATWGFSQPLFNYVIANDALQRVGAEDVLVFLALYHWLPVALLFVADRAIGRIEVRTGVALRVWRASLYLLVGLSFLRVLQLGDHINFYGTTASWLGIIVSLIVVLVVALLIFRMVLLHYRPATLLFLYLAPVSMVLVAFFISQVGLLGRDWDSTQKVPAEQIITLEEEAHRKSLGLWAEALPANDALAPVFLILFDALGGDVLFEDGQIDADRFPNLARFGQDSAVYNNATSNYIDTGFSAATLLSGKFVPDSHFGTEEVYNPSSGTLLSILADAGYSVEFYSTVLECPRGKLTCLDRALYSTDTPQVAANDFATWYLPKYVATSIRHLASKTLPSAIVNRLLVLSPMHRGDLPLWKRFLGRVSSSEAKGKFYYFHSFVAHQPYELNRHGKYVSVAGLSQDRSSVDYETLGQQYQEQVMFLDSLVGNFISALKREGLYEGSVIIVTGDHGPRKLGLRHFTQGWDYASEYPDEIDGMVPWVPLLIKAPGISPQTSSMDYQHIDLLPTVLEVLGMPTPPGLDGVSTFSLPRPDRTKIFHVKALKGELLAYRRDTGSGRWRRAD